MSPAAPSPDAAARLPGRPSGRLMRRGFLSAVAALAVLFTGGCGYFNSMYNARRAFAEAERARERGDPTVARTAYNDAIERAASSYRGHPDSRWADDALLLIGRSHFHLGQDYRAAAALRAMLEASHDLDRRSTAQAYLGAALARLDSADSAVQNLDSAIARLGPGAPEGALARRWRARLAFAADDTATAWRFLDEATQSRQTAFEVGLDAAAEAAVRRDTARLRLALMRVSRSDPRGAQAEAVNAVLRAAAGQGIGAAAFRAAASLDSAAWRPSMVDAVRLERATIGAASGEYDDVIVLLADLHDAAADVANAARLLQARLELDRMDDPADLEAVRQLLLPAVTEPKALELQRIIRGVQLLTARASEGSLLPLFAAAEMARDDMHAPRLAQALFLQFLSLDPASEWSGKAALAAHALGPSDQTRAALRSLAGNPYIIVAQGGDPAAVDLPEQRLARGLAGMRDEALADALVRDVTLGRATSVLDSTRAAARSDSVRIGCATLVDSLAITGIRADSTRAACLRGDSARVAWVLSADTTRLVPDPAAGQARPRTGAPPDTVPF